MAQVQAIHHEAVDDPDAAIKLFKDVNGNWFCSVMVGKVNEGRKVMNTATYNFAREAIREASNLIEDEFELPPWNDVNKEDGAVSMRLEYEEDLETGDVRIVQKEKR